MAELKWTLEAVQSLREIHEYIAVNRPATAFRTIESIINKVESLAAYPELGQRLATARRDDLRLLVYGHFRIPYVCSPTGAVTVLGVFHGLIFLPLK
ncbi:MAG: type II toxin-antitoxin system RelE/ParE family toxin [Thermoanaerobaculia bacterium]|nr:type II toxin-antitoxin system RelE/ParE family toxin [Thermoanaerobaculia bacterium]